MKLEPSTKLACNFCGKDSDRAKFLIRAALGACICEECVVVCVKVLADVKTDLPEIDPSLLPAKETT